MIALLRLALRPFLDARVSRARLEHQTARAASTAVGYARALAAAGRGQEAFRLLKRARQEFPGDAAVRTAYDSTRRRVARSKAKEALRVLARTASVDDHVRAADLLKAAGRPRRAMALLARASRIEPDHWGVELSLGALFLERFNATGAPEDLSRALDHLRRSRELSPDGYKTLLLLGVACAKGRLYDEAASCVESLLGLYPDDARAGTLRAHLDRCAAGPPPGQEAPPLAPSGAETEDGQPEPFRLPAPARRLFESVGQDPGVLAAFAVGPDGILGSRTAPDASPFDLSSPEPAVLQIVEACDLDGDRIGIGAVHSCHAEGDGWQVAAALSGECSLVAFFAGEPSDPAVKAIEATLEAAS
ncbi:MAG: hypothetical protein HY721_03905 [Planctomycetes bacterium]|nr:hypothetical protein [Planctomycetota bacterium]